MGGQAACVGQFAGSGGACLPGMAVSDTLSAGPGRADALVHPLGSAGPGPGPDGFAMVYGFAAYRRLGPECLLAVPFLPARIRAQWAG